MATKDSRFSSSSEGKQKSFEKSLTSENHGQFDNLNLNQNFKLLKFNSEKSSKLLSSDNKGRTDCDQTDNFRRQSSCKLNDKFLKTNFLGLLNPFLDEKIENQKPWKKDASKSANNSTLSLHIAAYENATDMKNIHKLGEQSDKCKTWKNMKRFSSNVQNCFEFPRQQEDKGTKPEIMQFKASQKLLNPNKVQQNELHRFRVTKFATEEKDSEKDMSQKSDTAKSDKRTEMKVYELEQDINEEKPMEDQDPPLPFLLPADMSLPLGAATPLMANFTDCEETTLSTLSYQFDVDHHDLCSDEVLRLLQFPLVGIVYGPGQRLVMPLRVRASHSDKEYVIYFVVDSGAKDVYLSENSYKLLGGGKKFTTVFVQDTYLFCQQAGDLNALWKEVNIIGASFLLKANLSMIISPHPYDYLGEHLRIFYLSKFEEIQNTFALAKSAKLQTPHLKEKASVVELPNVKGLNSFASSDPTNPHKALTLTAIPARGTEKLDSSKSSETS